MSARGPYALFCRDYLRTDPDVLIKKRLAKRAPADATAYYEIKDRLFDIIMASANEWAARTAWSELPAD